MSQTPENTARLSTLVNPDRIRATIKRLFNNRIDEVLAELFQNAQRSNSTFVEIMTASNGFTIQDNGHGIRNGIDGFHTLLKLAESDFDNDTIADQDPMGVGIVSLLTHDQVTAVTFSSGALELTVDTRKWWSESDYYSTWFERVVSLDGPVMGLRITVTCSEKLVESLREALKPRDQINSVGDLFQCSSPAQGYDGILAITLDSAPVRTTLPRWIKMADAIVSTTYKGCKLEIGYDGARSRSTVLWYGQLIIQRALLQDFHFHLEVKSGRPVNPLSPTRAGIIQDAAYNDLIEFVKAEIFKFLFDRKNRRRIKPAHIEACYKLNQAYAEEKCPYIIAESIETSESPGSFEEFNDNTTYDSRGRVGLFLYDELPLLLNEYVIVQHPDSTAEAEYGLRSFLEETGPAYAFRCGDERRVPVGTLWWKPEGEPVHDWFYKPGECGISYEEDKPPTAWKPITSSTVFVFNDPNSYDAAEVDFTVGTTESPISFLRGDAWAGFSPDDDHDTEPQEESYQHSLNYMIRSIIGKCVPRGFKLYDIQAFLKDKAAPVVEIRYHFKSGGKFVNPRRAYKPNSKNAGAMSPAEITVKTSVGEKVRLILY